MNMIEAVEEYQCPGCMYGPNPQECSKAKVGKWGCENHQAGTIMAGTGSGMQVTALGLPKGFCRFGTSEQRSFDIYTSYSVMVEKYPNLLSIYSLPVWKHLDKNGNTIIRWFSPRTNHGWTTVVLEDCRDKLQRATEITNEHIDYMD